MKCMSFRKRWICFLDKERSTFENKSIAFLIVSSLMDGYMLISQTDEIITSYLLTTIYSNFLFSPDAWIMLTYEQFNFALSNVFLMPRLSSFEEVTVKCVKGVCLQVWSLSPHSLLIIRWQSSNPRAAAILNYRLCPLIDLKILLGHALGTRPMS